MERYRSVSSFLKEKFGTKVYKISLRGGFSCPNRDGTKGSGGCIYCNPDSIQPFVSIGREIPDQVAEGIGYVKKRHGAAKFISYFQHFSNTYGSAPALEKLYRAALGHPDVVGLAISTRPDCVTDEALELLGRLASETLLWLELGLQSSNNETLKLINRGHTAEDFSAAVAKCHSFGIQTCAHIILGLPEETHADMMATIKFLADLKIGGVKIHNLHVLKDTKLAEMHMQGAVRTLELSEYASLVVDCLERLPSNVLIHRFNSHSPRHLTIAPEWAVNKLATMNAVHDELERRDTWQGKIV